MFIFEAEVEVKRQAQEWDPHNQSFKKRGKSCPFPSFLTTQMGPI